MYKIHISIKIKINNTERINPIILVTNPPVATPLGATLFCLTEKIIPSIPRIIPKNEKIKANTMLLIPIIKPTIPHAFVFAIVYLEK